MSEAKINALEHLQPMTADGYVFADARFDRLIGWTHVMMYLNEAYQCLDLSEKYNSLEAFDKSEQVMLAQALFRSAIIGYGKCYAQSSRGKVSLDRNAVFRENAGLKVKHDRMIEIRNSFVAHNGENDIDTATLAVKESADEILIRHTYTLITTLNEYDDYRQVLKYTDRYVTLALNKFLDKLQIDLGKQIRLG